MVKNTTRQPKNTGSGPGPAAAAMKILNISPELTVKYEKSALRGYRLKAAGIAGAGLALFLFAGLIEPNSRGFGSHQQLGLPECGFYQRTGYPCPTCGMTTAFAWMVRVHPLKAFVAQPAGALAALVFAGITVLAGYAALSGKKFCFPLNTTSVCYIALFALAAVLLSWFWQCAVCWRQSHP
jgi:hypothetical protein